MNANKSPKIAPHGDSTSRRRVGAWHIASVVVMLLASTSAVDPSAWTAQAQSPPPTTASGQTTNATSNATGAPEPVRLPQLSPTLRAPLEASPGPSRVAGAIINYGGPAGNSTATLVATTSNDATLRRTIPVLALGANQAFELNVTWGLPPGWSRITLIADSESQVNESVESDNDASTWAFGRHERPIQAMDFLRFEDGNGTPVPRPSVRVREENGTVIVSVDPGGRRLTALVNAAWLESRLGPLALRNASFGHATRGNESFHSLSVEGAGWKEFTFLGFQPRLGQAIHGRGSWQNLLFDERPMTAKVLNVPGLTQQASTVGTPNATQNASSERYANSLVIELGDGNPAGQVVWFNAAWLASLGIRNATFEYESGERIPFERVGGFYRVNAPHFSVLYLRNDGGQYWSYYYKLDHTDDKAVSRIWLDSSTKANALGAWLDVYARASTCGAIGNSMELLLNGALVAPFNPCDPGFWGTVDPSWGRFTVPLSMLTGGVLNSFEIRKTTGNWNDRNILLYMDNTAGVDKGRTDAVECIPECSDKPGELIWVLVVQTNDPPPTPTLLAPGWGATSVSQSPTLQWSAVSDPNGDSVDYLLYFGTSPSPPYYSSTYQTSHSLSNLPAGTTHYWRVVARDSRGATSPSTETRYFTTWANSAPPAPTLVSPATGASVSRSPALDWTAVTDPDGDAVDYLLYLGTSSPPAYYDSPWTDSWTTWALPPSTLHYWRVEARDSKGAVSPSSSTWSFTTGPNSAPGAAWNPTPASGASAQPLSLWLSWSSGGDVDSDALRHTVRLGTTDPPTQNVTGCIDLWSSYCYVSGLTWGTKYYWRVRTSDGWAPPVETNPSWTFTTNYAPQTPSAPSPVDWDPAASRNTAVSWTSGDQDGQAVTYNVYRREGTTTIFGSPVCTVQSAVSPISCPTWSLLKPSTTYQWQVMATDSMGATSPGPVWSFTTGSNQPPVACFSATPSFLVVSTSATTGAGCGDPEGDPLTYSWDWGDGSAPSSGSSASRDYGLQPSKTLLDQYCPSGTPTIRLTSYDNWGGQGSASQAVSILDYRDQEPATAADPQGDGLYKCREDFQKTSDTTRDADGDALNDYVESLWWPDREAVFCPPPRASRALNCEPNPRHKDLYVEMDYMGNATADDINDHLPPATVLAQLVTYYGGAPLSNPDGLTGITLHLDSKTESNDIRFDLGRANNVAHVPVLGRTNCSNDPEWRDFWTLFDNIKTPNIGAGRPSYFHYALWAHQICNRQYGGVARGVPHKDFVVSLGQDDPTLPHGDDATKYGTFVHEFGHDLGLDHSGGTGHPNFEPNYFSVMNYRPTFRRDGSRFREYSTRALDPLYEGGLNEFMGLNPYINSDPALRTYLDGFRIDWDCTTGVDNSTGKYVTHPPAPHWMIDWNCNTAKDAAGLQANVNGHTGDAAHHPVSSRWEGGDPRRDDCPRIPPNLERCESMTGFSDWPAVRFDGLKKNPAPGDYGFDQRFETNAGGVLGISLPACGMALGTEQFSWPNAVYIVVDRCAGNTGIWRESNFEYGWQASDLKLVGTVMECTTPVGPLSSYYIVLDSCAVSIEVWEECNGWPGWQSTDCAFAPPSLDPGSFVCDFREPVTRVILALQNFIYDRTGEYVELCPPPPDP